jgi:hypothetical protein
MKHSKGTKVMEQAKAIADAASKRAGGQTPARRIGIAEGKFIVPDDIDADNDLIAELFHGSSEADS